MWYGHEYVESRRGRKEGRGMGLSSDDLVEGEEEILKSVVHPDGGQRDQALSNKSHGGLQIHRPGSASTYSRT
jgi:hypothetical protein